MSRLKLLLVGMSFLAIILSPGLAAADVNDFVITSFKADETLSRVDPQGTLRIVERINVKFSDYNHGILRAIPDRYSGHSLQLKVNSVTSDSGAASQYTTYSSNGNTVLKIGDPSRTVTGSQEYTIDYTLRNVISFYDDHDELYWDVNGDQWDQTFDNVSVTIHLPNGLNQTKDAICYAGGYGSKDKNCQISSTASSIQASTINHLSGNQTLTYAAAFKKGYFQPSKWYETVAEYTKAIVGIFVPIVAIAGTSILYWWRRGRDAKGTGIIIPQYGAPVGLKPLAVGNLIDFKVDNRDITATIIDLAVRHYIKIVETKKDRIIGKDKLGYQLELLNSDLSKLDQNEKLLLMALFPTYKAGEVNELAKSKAKLYAAAQSVRASVESSLKNEGYFNKSKITKISIRSAVVLITGFLAFVIFCIVAFYVTGGWLALGIVLGGLIALPFWNAMIARTSKGVVAKEHVQGLKMYLETAEKDRLEKLQGPNAAYAANAAAPVKTVELFEKLLPYAIALGVEKQWATQFNDLYTSPPDWYSGNWTTFNAFYLATSLNQGIGSAVNTAFSAPSSSSGSGFGGGGGSGGGGGGGGGGGW
jgi:uncharacterized membrane protein